MKYIVHNEHDWPWYHQLINNAIHRPHAQGTRNDLGRRLRIERRAGHDVQNLIWDIAHIHWPIKLRPNGRLT